MSTWRFDYDSGEIVRLADQRRWRVENVPPLHTPDLAVDVAAVDAWVAQQPDA